jgi:alpha,alpha-trehalase
MSNYPKRIHELGELFEQVQLNNIYGDGKTFPDCIPKKDLEEIRIEFNNLKNEKDFDLKEFVNASFDLPSEPVHEFSFDKKSTAKQHIESLWKFLTRKTNPENSSLIQLPKPYVVPGGRFRECYYWDSYFTMLGLKQSGRVDLIENMVANFAHLIDTIGYIPNGNRTYFLGRSQPPFFSLMVKLLHEEKGDILEKYLSPLEKEYSFWMSEDDNLSTTKNAVSRVVLLEDGSILNRYWDANDIPRPESYKEDVELSHNSKQDPKNLFRNLRAAAESGWDFSSRWFKAVNDFSSTHTTEIIPVDLNCLLLHHEQTLCDAYQLSGNKSKVEQFVEQVKKRKSAIRKYCWNDSLKFYCDYDFKEKKIKSALTLAGCFPLFFEVATPNQAEEVARHIESKFLKPGGLTTTLVNSGQQWDAPNGWAPLQWIGYKGLKNYGFDYLADKVKTKWLSSNDAVFNKTGKMTEKYDVWNEQAEASGGEYPNQDGFGWTNGVYLAINSL